MEANHRLSLHLALKMEHFQHKRLANPAVYGQTAQSPSTPEGYDQRAPQSQTANNPTFTTKEYSQLMALLHNKNGKDQPLANATGHGHEEGDWSGQAF
ncbi:hypothetical protein ACFX2A_009960 [Malus domestica]